jgi:hypothetical protein
LVSLLELPFQETEILACRHTIVRSFVDTGRPIRSKYRTTNQKFIPGRSSVENKTTAQKEEADRHGTFAVAAQWCILLCGDYPTILEK